MLRKARGLRKNQMGSTISTLKNSTDRMAGMMRRRMGEASMKMTSATSSEAATAISMPGSWARNQAAVMPSALAAPHQTQASESLRGLLTKRR